MIYTDYQDPGRGAAIALSAAMHVLLALALIFSVNWQTKQVPVAVELWTAPPTPAVEPPPTAEPSPPPPEPKPAPRPEPPPPRPEPKVEVKAPPPKPDIAVQKEKPKPEPKKQEAKKPAPDFSDLFAQESRQLDRRKEVLEDQRRVESRLLAAETQRRAAADQARTKAKADYENRLRGKIRGNIIVPPGLQGNPKALFRVEQLPSGEVLTIKMLRSSGSGPYDRAVEAAILKSSPLPLPSDMSLFARELDLTFCPKDSDTGCPR